MTENSKNLYYAKLNEMPLWSLLLNNESQTANITPSY